jgi:MFS family permease
MQHSHEAFDRPGGIDRVQLAAPLRDRDFRRLWIGMTASLVGDGAFLVAVAWHVYSLRNTPSAMAEVATAISIPTILLLAFGGLVTDRVDRRRVMISADLARTGAVGGLALLAITGSRALWPVIVLGGAYGAATAFFNPAFDAIVPELVPTALLAQANALDQFVRPVAFRLVGPAVGGLLIGMFGTGYAFALDAASFLVSAFCVATIPPRGVTTIVTTPIRRDIREGIAYVFSRSWLWGTLAAAAFAYLVFMGPAEVLVPYLVKNTLHAGSGALGMVYAAGGLGALIAAFATGQRGLPRRQITWMYIAWTIATIMIAGYGVATSVVELMVACFAFNAFETAGTIIWATTKQQQVPARLLGRVSSLDWLVSIGLLPLSFALTSPVSAAFGAQATLVGAGLVGAVITLAGLFIPGMRSVERAERSAPATLRPRSAPAE